MKNEIKSPVSELIDFKMRCLDLETQAKEATTQLTVRVPESLKVKLDVMSEFVGGTRNSLLIELLEIACDEAIERINDNPYIGNLTINGKTIHQAIEAAMKGEVANPGLADAEHETETSLERLNKRIRNMDVAVKKLGSLE